MPSMLAPPDPVTAKDKSAVDAEAALHALSRTAPLPRDAGPPSLFTEGANVLGSTIHLAGISLVLGEEVVCGSAASLHDMPLDRAYFELLERLSVVRAMTKRGAIFPVRDSEGNRLGEIAGARLFATPAVPQWRAARSNGVAIGATWKSASQRAHWELLERDRVLRSWYGGPVPVPITDAGLQALFPEAATQAYDVQAYDLGSEHEGVVAGVFAFPRGEEPLAFGFAARSSRGMAVRAAAIECVQRLGFLWGEPIPTSDPELAPNPDYHQEFYLVPANHAVLRGWLRGEHARYGGLLRHPEETTGFDEKGPSAEMYCADLTPPELAGRLWVAKAIHPHRMPLVFGHGHPWLLQVPEPLSVHPLA